MGVIFLLDTNICIYIINRRPPQVFERFAQAELEQIGISSITVAELAYGVAKSKTGQSRISADAFLAPLSILSFDESVAWRYGELCVTLERQGKTIGPLDLQIAAHALELGATLVTNNESEFSRVEGLKLENWIWEEP